jgi:hypothetical protein
MRTQSSVDTDIRPPAPATEPGAETLSFRASSLDEAVALAEESLGAPVRVVAANRIRRGGIGGFFASDLGVEVSVALDDETIEQALERLVSETAVDERAKWAEHRVTGARPAAPTALAQPTEALPAQALVATAPVATVPAAPRRSLLMTPKAIDTMATADARVRVKQRDEEPSMVRVEEIIEELQVLTRGPQRSAGEGAAAFAFAPPVPSAARTVVLPTLPPRPVDIARAASANAAASQAVAVEHERARDVSPDSTAAAHIEIDVESPAVPSQQQVELAVAATDQLIESLQRDGVKRLSVRIVLRTGDRSAVEAEAQWEAS